MQVQLTLWQFEELPIADDLFAGEWVANGDCESIEVVDELLGVDAVESWAVEDLDLVHGW